MQQFVHRRQRHLPPQRRFELGLDLADHQNAADTGRFHERFEQFGFAFKGEMLSVSPAAHGLAFIAYCSARNELIAQTTRPAFG